MSSTPRFRRDKSFNSDLRTPPHSEEAEQAVLGGLMLDKAAWDQVGDVIVPDHFFRPDHKLIFESIASLAGEAQPTDPVTVSEHLQRLGKLNDAGGLAYLGTLTRDTPGAANARAYAEIVKERALLRELVTAGGEIAGSVWEEEGESARDLVERAERRIFAIAEGSSRGKGYVSAKQALPALIDQIDDLYNNPNKPRGLPTGFIDFDNKTGGLRGGDLLIIAGRPSMGKSTLAINMAEHAALKDGVRASVAIFSLEMPADQILTRMLSSVGSVHLGNIRSGKLSEDDWPRITGATKQLQDAKIFIDDTPALADGAARALATHQARAWARPDRGGLSAAHDRAGYEGKSRDRNFGDLAGSEGAGEGIELPGDRVVAAEPRRGAAREQEAGDVGFARVRGGRHAGVSRRWPARADQGFGRAAAGSVGIG
jgi:replicative DNA helicase